MKKLSQNPFYVQFALSSGINYALKVRTSTIKELKTRPKYYTALTRKGKRIRFHESRMFQKGDV